MKRINDLYHQIISIENLQLADTIARKGKGNQYGIIQHDRNRDENILKLHQMLTDKTYKTSRYSNFKIQERKEREISRLPYFPDRIVHHAIMIKMEPIFVSTFTADTYSCIKRRGIHKLGRNLRKSLFDVPGTQYCLKIDIKKFYPNINHTILKQQIRRKIKDRDLIWLLDEIIDSAPGVPIGNYLSQYFANFNLTGHDHYLKEVLRVKYYFRYADDMVFLAGDKPYLHDLLLKIKDYLQQKLKLEVKSNYQVFPVEARGIDVVGYVYFHTHTLLRLSIKRNFARKVARGISSGSLAAYIGWAKHCNSKHLIKKLLYEKV